MTAEVINLAGCIQHFDEDGCPRCSLYEQLVTFEDRARATGSLFVKSAVFGVLSY
jgi:hypothetical protein